MCAIAIRRVHPGDALWPRMATLFPRASTWLADSEDGGDYRFLVAMDHAGNVLGGSVIEIGRLRFGPLADMRVGYLEDILVLEGCRRKGVGSAVLRVTLAHAWENRCENVRWTVSYGNTAGIALYRSLGFAFVPDEDPSQAEPELQYTVIAINPTRVHV
jgi:ribosomal protein S18 acetylase RimI-like enzyme